MPKASPAVLGFTTGLNSPSTTGRIDLATYPFGSIVFDNFLPQVEGPATKRPGTKYIAPAKYDDRTTRVFDFVFSNEQAYMLEFGDEYMRVFRNQEVVLDPDPTKSATVLSITNTNPIVVSVLAHSVAVDQHVFLSDTDIPELNEQFFRVLAVTATTLDLEFDGTTLPAQTTPAGTVQAVYEIATPFTEAMIPTIKTAPSVDVLYMIAPGTTGVEPQKLIRLADDDWTIEPIWTSANLEDPDDEQLWRWPPFGNSKITGTIELTVAVDAAPGATTNVAASAALFEADDVGRYLKVQGEGATAGFGEVTTFNSDVSVEVTVKSRFPAVVIATATRAWAWGAFDAKNGYPRAISFFEDRLYMGGTAELPQSWWASVSGDFENYRPYSDDGSGGVTIAADSGIFNTINSDQQNIIEWMLGQETLFVGTGGGEFTIEGAVIEQGIQPGNLFVKKRAAFGSRKDVQAVAVDTVVLFCQRAGRRVRELAYRLENDRYFAPDMNRMSREAVFGRIIEMAYQQEPNRTLWCVMEDGTFASFTYEREEQVTAWATQTIGGSVPFVASSKSIPSQTDDEDEQWIVIKRTFDGVTQQSIEIFDDFWDRSQVLEDARFLDSSFGFSNPQSTATDTDFPFGSAAVEFLNGHTFVLGDIIELVVDPLKPNLDLNRYQVTFDSTTLIGIAEENGTPITGTPGEDGPLLPSTGATFRNTTTRACGAIHLAGQTVGLVTSARVRPDVTVDQNGCFDLPEPAGQAYIGHRYEARIRTNPLEAGAADGTAQGKTKRVQNCVIRLDQTGVGLFFGSNFDDEGTDAVMDPVPINRWENVAPNQAVTLFDGDTESLAMPAKYEQEGTLALKHVEPLPCTIIALFPQLNTQPR